MYKYLVDTAAAAAQAQLHWSPKHPASSHPVCRFFSKLAQYTQTYFMPKLESLVVLLHLFCYGICGVWAMGFYRELGDIS